MKSKIANKVLTGILCVGLMLQMSMPIAYAEEITQTQETKPITITAFADLTEEVKNITVPMGTTEEELALPEKVTAVVYKQTIADNTTEGNQPQTEDVILSVTWESDKTFSQEEAGEYTYTAKLTEKNYALAESVKMPAITVHVVKQPTMLLTQTSTMTLVEGAIDGGDINVKGLDLSKNAPTVMTQYKAGDGYVLFTPASKASSGKNTIELNNATLEAPENVNSVWVPFLMVLPSGDVNLIIKGDNKLIRSKNCTIYGTNCKLKVTGEGNLSATNGKILLEGESTFYCDENTSAHLNLMVVTKNSTEKKQEIFGSASGDQIYNGGHVNLILHKNAEFILQTRLGQGGIPLYGNLDIAENAKLIIDEDTILKIEADGGDLPVVTNNGGSILVKGELILADNSYAKNIAKMITTEGTGRVTVGRSFDEERGQVLHSDNGGEWNCGKGTLKWEPVVDEQGELLSGTITLNNADISIKGRAYDFLNGSGFGPGPIGPGPVPGPGHGSVNAIFVGAHDNVPITLNIIGNNTIENPYGAGILKDDLILTGSGTLNGKGRMLICYESKLDTSDFKGKLNGIVYRECDDINTVYGTVSYSYNDDQEAMGYTSLTVEKDAALTIEQGALLRADTFTNKGTVINNGTLSPERDVDHAELQNWVYGNINIKGNGIIKVRQTGGSGYGLFTNDGQIVKRTIDTPLDFSKATEDKGDLAKDGYHWDNQNQKLTLENLNMWGNPSSNGICAITLPEDKDVTLELKGYNKIEGFNVALCHGIPEMAGLEDLMAGGSAPEAKGSLTICGNGTLVTGSQVGDKHNKTIFSTAGKLILQSGNLIIEPNKRYGITTVGMEIKGGSLGSETFCAPIKCLGDFTMNGGKVITGDSNKDVSLLVSGNLTITGGELITGKAVSSIALINGNLTITGGKLTVQNVLNSKGAKTMGIEVVITGKEDKMISISGGTVDIKSNMSAVTFAAYLGGTGKAILETNGMTLTTNPAGGTLKSVAINIPASSDDDKDDKEQSSGTIYALTADESLKTSYSPKGQLLMEACTSLTAVKASSNGGGSGHHSSSSSSIVKPTEPAKQEQKPPQKETPKSLETVKKDGAEKVKSLKDVKESSWFYEGTVYALGNGWFAGTTETTFSPSNPMTREMFRIVLGRMGGDANDLMDNNRLKENITREQLVTLLYRMAQKKGLVKTGGQDTQNIAAFADGAQVSAWSKEAMVWANLQGIIKGNDQNMINPKAGTSRAEVAVMLMRFDTIARNQ